jgi:general secretion pathway protein N
MVERQTGGRLTLGDAQGTLWRGSAFVGGAPGEGGAVTPLLPGRFSWRLSPLVLFGQVDMELANPQALAQPVRSPAAGRSGRSAPANCCCRPKAWPGWARR